MVTRQADWAEHTHRTLELLQEMNLVQRLNMGEGTALSGRRAGRH